VVCFLEGETRDKIVSPRRRVKLWDEYMALSEDRLVALSFIKEIAFKVNSIRIGDTLCVIYSLFCCFARELKGISGTRCEASADNPVP
jgi:hypothetical protein